jgi:hypothetical protein
MLSPLCKRWCWYTRAGERIAAHLWTKHTSVVCCYGGRGVCVGEGGLHFVVELAGVWVDRFVSCELDTPAYLSRLRSSLRILRSQMLHLALCNVNVYCIVSRYCFPFFMDWRWIVFMLKLYVYVKNQHGSHVTQWNIRSFQCECWTAVLKVFP